MEPARTSRDAASGNAPATDARRIADALAEQLHKGFGQSSGAPLEVLRSWRDRIDAILKLVVDGIAVFDFTGALVYANQPAREVFGGGSELLGQMATELFVALHARGEDGRVLTAAVLQELLGHGGEDIPELVLRIRAAGEDGRWLLLRTAPIWDEHRRVLATVAVLHDVTEQKRGEGRLRFLADASAVLSRSLDPRETVTSFGHLLVPAMADAFVLHLKTEDDSLELESAICQLREREQPLIALTNGWVTQRLGRSGPAVVLKSRDPELHEALDEDFADAPENRELLSRTRVQSALVAPLVARSRSFGTLTLFTMKGRPRFTAAELVLVSDLSSRLAMALDNAALYRESLEASERKDDFIAMLSHELRNPLSPIVTALELLKLNPESPRRYAHIQMIERQAHHLTRLVDDVLDVSRISRGKVNLHWSDVSLVDVVAQALETVGPIAEKNRQTLRSDVDPSLCLRADPIRLTQIFANLLSNAVRYSGDGAEISVRAERKENDLVLTVADNGTGISEELLEEIFEPFTQGRRAVERIHGGLGLGLTLVKSLAELHGGTAAAHSEGHGKGATFTVTLPASLIVQGSKPFGFDAPTAEVHPASAQRLALVVDDNTDAAESMCEALEMWGYATLRAHDGETAMAISLERSPDLVVLDIGLPGIDGYEIARRLRAQPQRPPIIVGVSGYGRDVDFSLSKDAGFHAHLVKPVQLARLRDELDRLLS